MQVDVVGGVCFVVVDILVVYFQGDDENGNIVFGGYVCDF